MAGTHAGLKEKIKRALSDARGDDDLLERLSELAKDWRFSGFTYLFAPVLWRRNRVRFRPFILAHFGEWAVDEKGSQLNPWKGAHASELEQWYRAADEADDVEVVRRLQAWKIRWDDAGSGAWQDQLVSRVERALDGARRRTELAKFELAQQLDESHAVKLYELDPSAAGPFIQRHMVRRLPSWWKPSATSLWQELRAAAQRKGDDAFADLVYKRTAEDARWKRDVLDLAERVSDSDDLCAGLKRLQIDWLPSDSGEVFLELLRKRGNASVPYVLGAIQGMRRTYYGAPKGYEKLVELAWERRWLALWAAALRSVGSPADFNKQVRRLLRDSVLPGDERRRCLGILAGVGREWNFGPFGAAAIPPLEDDVAAEMYERSPEMVRGPFKKHVFSGWHMGYAKLTDAVLRAHDEVLIDYLASRLVTRSWFHGDKATPDVVVRLSQHYEALAHDEREFARRGANVLGAVPAFAVYDYERLIKSNRLARVLWERRASLYLSSDAAIRDLLESPQIFAQLLAFRALARDDDRARRLASESLDLLRATLLRPLHRKTRFKAFGALWRAAEHDEPTARKVADAAIEAFALPDKRYPKEALLALVARIKHRYPALRSASEELVVYGEALP